MAKFTIADYVRVSKKWYWLKADLVFSFTLKEALGAYPPYYRELLAVTGLQPDEMIFAVAPKGFMTDLASVPNALQDIYDPDGPWALAAIIHDIIYQTLKNRRRATDDNTPFAKLNEHHTRLLADRIFLIAMRATGVNIVTQNLFFNAVRLGGESSYGGTPCAEDYGLEPIHHADTIPFNYEVFRSSPTEGVPEPLQNTSSEGCLYHTVHYGNMKRSFVYDCV